MPRKHLIASKINNKQQNHAKLLQKLSKEIKSAAKTGGPNPQNNPRLKLAIEKALKNNQSMDSIEKNILGVQKDQTQIENFEYEVFGPENSKFIVGALTDNNNRTLANLKAYIKKMDCNIAKINAVKTYFEHLGIIELPSQPNLNEDALINALIDFPVKNLEMNDTGCEIQVLPEYYYQIIKALKEQNFEIEECHLAWVSNELVQVSSEFEQKVIKFFQQIQDDDDLNYIFSNIDFSSDF